MPAASTGEFTEKAAALLWPEGCCLRKLTLGLHVYHLISSLRSNMTSSFKHHIIMNINVHS